tara:strand:- start:396 stop:881 length:486 start_codon:yes stop_codon:yes gene_type:complete
MNNINQEIQDLEATLVSLKAKAEAQESTLTPVSFESKGELAKALMDGRTFKTSGGITLMYANSDTGSSPFRVMQDGEDWGPMLVTWESYADLQEINAAPAEPWYLNIPPEGVWCYVSDSSRPNTSAVNVRERVTHYDTHFSAPFRSNCSGWKYATPINGGK